MERFRSRLVSWVGARPRGHAWNACLRPGLLLCVLALMVWSATSAHAVLIAGPDGTINVTPPSPDPGFANVGDLNSLSGVYVGNGWVLTARHVGVATIELDGIPYDPVPGSQQDFTDGVGNFADLIAFKLVERPTLPDLTLASAPPRDGEDVVMIGNGRNRGASTSWSGVSGWEWDLGRTLRWGTNRISDVGMTLNDTAAFATEFNRLTGSRRNDPEAQVVPGDSGGGAFVWNGGSAELVGILFAKAEYLDQPESTSLYGNLSYVVDLDAYRSEILAVITQPDCQDGLDVDGDGWADHPEDPGCDSPDDDSELSDALVCDNGIDDDEDGLTDYPDDPDCDGLLGTTEVPEPSFVTGLLIGSAWLALTRRLRRS